MDSLSKEGKSLLLFADENNLIGVIAVKDNVKKDREEHNGTENRHS